ncbi:hypothetical protein WJX79_010913 [Trebouxia sp. C0005]
MDPVDAVSRSEVSATPPSRRATFGTQANALCRKNLVYQKRNTRSNCCIILSPIFVSLLLLVIQVAVDHALDKPANKCGCLCLSCCSDTAEGGKVCHTTDNPCLPGSYDDCNQYDDTMCGFEYSNSGQAAYCAVSQPSSWPALMQVPFPRYRAASESPAAAMLFTGEDESTATALAGYLFVQQTLTAADLTDPVATFQSQAAQGVFYGELFGELGLVLGTSLDPVTTYFIEPAFVNSTSMFNMVNGSCASDTSTALLNEATAGFADTYFRSSFNCTQEIPVWSTDTSTLDRTIFCGYKEANCNQTSSVLTFGEYSQAWDFRNTVAGQLQVDAYHNASKDPNAGNSSPLAVRVNQGLNLATNAFLRWSLGAQYSAKLLAIMEMPKQETHLSLDFSSLLGPIFYCWLSQLLLPLLLVTLVYEKQHRLRIMMKMHGLGDSAYWIIQYAWFLFIYCCYIAILLLVGSAINLKFFRLTNYGLQIIFFFVWGNCLIAFAFLASIFFTNAKTANVVAFLWVFGTGLLNNLLMENYYKDHHSWVYVVELIPSFALYRALYEQAAYAFKATYQNGGHGLNFGDLHDYNNHWIYATCVCAVETVLAVVLAWYLEQVLASGTGVRRHPFFFLQMRKSKGGSGERAPTLNRPWFGWLHRQGHAHSQAMPPNKVVKMVGQSALGNGLQYKPPDRGLTTPEASNLEPAAVVQDPEVALNMESADVQAERDRVSAMTNFDNECIVMRDLRKVYPSQDGNPEKQAVRNLTMAVERGECFGLLGPNGAGKTSAINMLVGLMEPSSGTATVEGLDVRSDMADIYAMMGVCPQHDLLWETLTGREHLLFYGRLKNLKGLQLQDAVTAALRSVNLLNGGVGDKQVQTYSGGMKRRLSVAISLMGNPAVVYLDEPSTGLDPASRRNLWDVVKAAKRNRGIILTTHSMQEAEVLCDRLGIFVDGQLVCIGNPKELTARYGGYMVFTVTTPVGPDVAEAAAFVQQLCPSARPTYALGGTQKYELPTSEVSLSQVFVQMRQVQHQHLFVVLDWGVANAKLEEVFIKFAKSIGAAGGN